MKMLQALVMIPVLLGFSLALHAVDGVQLEKSADSYQVTADSYTAKVDANGALTSLVIGGMEFIAPATVVNNGQTVLPGLYADSTGQWNRPYQPAGVQEQHDNVIQCDGNGWRLRYTFLPDAIDLAYEGNPEGARGFNAGFPPAALLLSLAHNLQRVCDPAQQGELGWPVAHTTEPGDFAVLAANGAGFIAEGASGISAISDPGVMTPPHRSGPAGVQCRRAGIPNSPAPVAHLPPGST